jgi:ribonucleoside-diphosphate reductase alpha chain
MVRSTTGVASGPVSFMRLYDASTDAVKQGGTRRGANMGILRVDHPDVLDFITCKEDLSQITNFNISVGVTTSFMNALKAGTTYDLIEPSTGEVAAKLDARMVWEKMLDGAWRTGEPGCFFIDEAERYNPVPHLGAYEATNPCGEQPLLPYDVCNLGSINLGYYVKGGVMDWDAMKRDTHLATHFLDNIIDVNKYPLPEIDALSKRIRRIGFGVMGFADALVRLGIPYDSPEGVDFGRTLQEFVDTEAKRESERLANERGPFPEWARSIFGPDETCARDENGQRIRSKQLLRNCNVTTVAPTGTISIIAGCSSGIEPLFAVAFMRNQAGVMMPDVNEDFVAVAKREGWYSDDLIERIAKEGHIHFDEVPEKWRRVFVTAHDITPEWHVRMQAAFQEHCDSAISKTTNFPHAATRDDVRAIYELAYDLKCKGVTVYRDGSRDNQVLSTGATAQASASRDEKVERREMGELQGTIAEMTAEMERLKQALYDAEAENLQRRVKRSRPDRLRGTTIRKETPLGTMFVNITEDEKGQPFEVFINLGKAGGAAMADAEAMGRMISLALRSGIPLREVHKQLRGISSDRAVGLGPNKVLSVPDAIGIALEEWTREKQGVQQELLSAANAAAQAPRATPEVIQAASDVAAAQAQMQMGFDAYNNSDGFMQTCPDCGSQLELAEGCAKCHVCGFSECG